MPFTLSRMRPVVVGLALTAGATMTAVAQGTAADGPIIRAHKLSAIGAVKMYNAFGSMRIVGWDRDSIAVRGRLPRGCRFYFSAVPEGVELGIEESSDDTTHLVCDLVVYMPKRGTFSVKTVSAPVSARDVSGWVFTVSGSVEVSGTATSMEVQSMTGTVDANVTTPWIRIIGGNGRVLVRGAPEDVDVSTIGGAMSIEARSIVRGQFASVTGDIHYTGAPPAGGIFELTSHSGAVELSLPSSTSAVFTLSSVSGQIVNGLAAVRPVTTGPHSLRLNVGRGEAQVTVRTFKGAIRLRPQ